MTLKPLRSHPMTAHARPLPVSAVPAGPARLRAVGGLRLLTWPALDASGVDTAVTARSGGVSSGPYATLNLSLGVGDDPASVLENRRRLAAGLGAGPGDFVFARQVHGAGVRVVGEADRGRGAFTLDDAIPDTDALVTASAGLVLAILTADCVPIVLHDPEARVLACVHAGWRGTVARVCAAALAAMRSLGSRPSRVVAGVGPAVAAARYQVGADVYRAVGEAFGPAATAFIRPDSVPERWLLDLWAANRFVLREAGVPAAQIKVTDLPTGPVDVPAPADPAGRVDPPASADRTGPGDLPPSAEPTGCVTSDDLTDPARHGYFFSDRAVRPCGRLALVARLREDRRPEYVSKP
jgi:polyphenol oxidase